MGFTPLDQPRTVLVTGGFGFLGSHLVERLLELGAKHVHVVDDGSSCAIDAHAFLQKQSDTLKLAGMPANEWPLSYDRLSIKEWSSYRASRLYAHHKFDEIYHLASVVGPVGVLRHAGKIVSSVVDDTYRMIEVAQHDGARLCDVSTSEIYGGGNDGLCSESDPKIIPAKISVRLEYAVAKLACEVALINTTRVSDLFGVIVRPFNIAGPRQSSNGGFVLPRFIGQALRGEPLTVYGKGSAVRAFTHVKDVADGIVRALRYGTRGCAYNVGNRENKTTILELAQRVIRITKSLSMIEHVDPKDLHGPMFEEAHDKYPDAELAECELGWDANHTLDDIVRDAVDYIRAGRVD